MTFTLYALGGEQQGWQKLLLKSDWTDLGVSYWSLRKRLPKTKPYLFSEKVDDRFTIFLDSGGGQVTKAELTVGETEDYAEGYLAFVAKNADRLAMVAEVDARALGPKWREQHRAQLEDIVGDRALPIWHHDDGERELDRLAQSYERVGIHEDALAAHGNLAVRVNGMAGKYGTLFHCVASAKPDDLRAVHFSSAATSSWLSPMKYGETFVWDGTSLSRYPASMKDQARRRHRMLFEREGLDADAILADDADEVAKLTLWSLKQMVANVDRRRPGVVVDLSLVRGERQDAEEAPAAVGRGEVEVRKNPAQAAVQRPASERTTLPVMGFDSVRTVEPGEDGSQIVGERLQARLNGRSARVCDSCYLAAQCPAMTPGADCAYDLPIELKTKDQLSAALRSALEMQVQRVAFMRFAEELGGGYADPNLSSELDRLYRMTAQLKEIEEQAATLQITAKGGASAGVMSALFGDRAASLRELPQPIGAADTNRLLAGVLEAPPSKPHS